jgi:hypothetical protein
VKIPPKRPKPFLKSRGVFLISDMNLIKKIGDYARTKHISYSKAKDIMLKKFGWDK